MGSFALLFSLLLLFIGHAHGFNNKAANSSTSSSPSIHLQQQHKYPPIFKRPTVLLCTIVKQEDLYLEEWLQYHQLLGFDFAEVHDNDDSPSQFLISLQSKYGKFLKLSHSPGTAMQESVYRKCLEKYQHKKAWIANIDADEFIALKNHSRIQDFLLEIAPRGGSVVLNWSLFCGDTATSIQEYVLSRFTRATELSAQVKTIVYAPHAKRPSIHAVHTTTEAPIVDGAGKPARVNNPLHPGKKKSEMLAYINHYHTKSYDEYVKKSLRGAADTNKRMFNMTHVQKLAAIDKRFYAHNQCTHDDTLARDFFLQKLHQKKVE